MDKMSLSTIGVLVSLLFLMTSCVNEVTVNYDLKYNEKSTANMTITGEPMILNALATEFRKNEDFSKIKVTENTLTQEFDFNQSGYTMTRKGWFIRRTFETELTQDFEPMREWDPQEMGMPAPQFNVIVTVPGKLVEVSDNCEIKDNKAHCDIMGEGKMTFLSKCWFC